MVDSVLYFPYIKVPQNQWFTQVLLYWDRVGSIIPSEYVRGNSRLGNYTSDLVSMGLLQEIVPSDHDSKIPEFRSAFLNLIDNNQNITGSYSNNKAQKSTRIHIEKMLGSGLSYDLEQRGLARPLKYPWFEVELTTANLFMGYLASVLGKLDEIQMCPITDEMSSLSVFSTTPRKILTKQSLLEQFRMDILQKTLPSPADIISARELYAFKDKYAELLPSYRRFIESFLIDLSIIEDPDQRSYKLELFNEESRERIQEIISRMNDNNWKNVVFGTFCGIVAAAIPGITSLVTGNELLALSALPGLISATYYAYSGKKAIQKQIISSPLAYAAYAGKKFGSNKRPGKTKNIYY